MSVFSGSLSGSIAAMPSKSMSHRAIIAASLCSGVSTIQGISLSQDVAATLRCVKGLGAEATLSGDILSIKGGGHVPHALLDCGESGSTYRMLYPVAPLVAERAEFLLAPSLESRPIMPLVSLLQSHGVKGDKHSVSGRYSHGDFLIPGDISSQFISGLIFALSLLDGESRIIPTTPVQSAGYVEMTRNCLHAFGGNTCWQDEALLVRPAALHPALMTIPGDYSHAAMFLAAGAIYGSVTVTGLMPDPTQRDMAMLEVLARMGAGVSRDESSVTVTCAPLNGVEVDGADCPDMLPALAAAACTARGKTRIFNAARLRLKESDRLSAMAAELGRLGADITETRDGLIINGGRKLHGCRCLSHNDHRIAMMLCIMGGICGGIELDELGCIAKSAPRFSEEFMALGGKIS